MGLDLSFKQVCDFIKTDEPGLIDAVDKLLGFTLVCSPAFLGPAAAAALPTIAVKNEIVRLGKTVFEAFSAKKDGDYVARQRRMEVAYGLISFTAFFEAVDRLVPDQLRNKIALLEGEKIFLAKSTRAKNVRPSDNPETPATLGASSPLAAIATPFPHPTETLAQQMERQSELWKQMGSGFCEFLQKLAVWEDAKDKEQAQIISAIEKVPQVAAECFEAQYFELARRYEDFAVWANLQSHKKTAALLGSLSEYVQQHAALAKSAKTAIDIGLARMHQAVVSIPETLKISQATEIVDSLMRHYNARVVEPIAEEKDEPQGDKPRLRFPRACDAFVPQAFQVLRWTTKVRSLEDEATWKDLERRDDLGAFLLSLLSSPFSTETPTVVLGHPGSGKSLLTTVISAQLMSKHYTAIRVPLREVDAEAGIVAQIEERIRRITNIGVDSWAKLSGAFRNNPPLVILDGYDELLQASGRVFSAYLKDVQTFQKNEAEQGRPVRIIVTSRITLIDKATIPTGATIIRLLEFDKRQRDRWISIWNRENANYFKKAHIKEFALPKENDDGAAKVLALAEQPLLLLMLALYDSQDNQLRKSKSLDRTILYDSLLRRFVTREREKDSRFIELGVSEQKKELDTEMQRLAVAALGMYNRRKLHILSPELNDDIAFFGLARPVSVIAGRPLSQADLLLGSFFFVHKSKAQLKAGAAEHHEETAAFEFLHNTFGEFLTADFILRQALAEVAALKALQEHEDLRPQLEQRLGGANGLSRAWFASVVYTPLFTRPVVLEMIREWIGHSLKRRQISKQEFVSHLDTIVLNQIRRLLSKREMPSIIRKDTAQEGYRAPFGDHPLLGHIAIYSINLILFRIIVDDKPFVFDEGQIITHEDGARPWDRLAYIWRSWFALDNLNGVTAVMLAERRDSKISVRAKDKFQVAESQNRLETCLNVGVSLADNISSGLAGLLLFEPGKDATVDIEDIAGRLNSEKIQVDFQIAMKRLLRTERGLDSETAEEYGALLRQSLETALREDKREELEHICLSLRRTMSRLKFGNLRGRRPGHERLGSFLEAIHQAIPPGLAAEVAGRNPRAALVLWEMAKEMPNSEWTYRLRRDFMEGGFGHRHPAEMMERDPDTWVAWLQLLQETGSWRLMERHGKHMIRHEFFERMFHPRQLLELSERSPEAALAWIELARKVGGERFLERLDREFLEQAFHPRQLLELSERNPEAAVAWLQLAREVGGERFLQQLDSKFLEQALHPRQLLKLSERSPEAALALIRLAREVGGEGFLRRLEPGLFERAFDPHRLIELSEWDPDAAFAWVQLAREVGGEGALRRLEPELFERVLHPRYLLELIERNPESALGWLELAREVGGERFLGRLESEFFDRLFTHSYFTRLLHRKPAAFGTILRIVRSSEDARGTDAILSWLCSPEGQLRGGRWILNFLPLSALPDIHWLANQRADSPGGELLRHWLRENGLDRQH